MPTLQLADEDARIVALAVAYHLGRPGSETDPETLRRHELGLAPVQQALAPRLGHARVEIEVTPYQLHRIDEGLLGVTNELKAYEMAQRQSSVPGFTETLRRLFPDLIAGQTADDEADEDRESALDLVERVVALRRRLASAVQEAKAAMEAEREAAAAAAAAARRAERPWWRFW